MMAEEDPMRSRALAALLLAVSVGVAAAAGQSPFVGTWHWNRTASKSPPGEPLPRDVVLDITNADARQVDWRLTIVDPDGERGVQSFKGSGGGKPVAVQGRDDGSTGAFTVTATTLVSLYTYPKGATDRASCTLSADGKRMTCQGVENDGKGHTARYTDVYDRE
jgi:hypothetical protein